jgi:fatty-acyl-CoA synthase
MKSTMQDAPLLIRDIVLRGEKVYGSKQVFTVTPSGVNVATFRDVAANARRLASLLVSLGVEADSRVGTIMWNTQAHMEVYLAVPTMGAILHTLNVRLFPEQLAFIINDADDQVIVVDESLIPVLAKIRNQIPNVKHIIVKGSDAEWVLGETINYDEAIAAQSDAYEWPDLDERQAAILCYTSGTTGDPKGVLYSHRSTWLHSIASTTSNSVGLSELDRALAVVPMFHVNAWGLVYTAFMAGTDLIMPNMLLKGEYLLQMIEGLRPTIALGVPTIWNDLLRAASEKPDSDFSSLRGILAGGAAVPRTMIEAFKERHGVDVVQGWGMTETSPLAAVSIPPSSSSPDDEIAYRTKTGRVVAGIDIRLVDVNGTVLPWDGVSVGEYELRGPWVTASYYHGRGTDSFHDGWLRTGDIGTLDDEGFMVISDRTKDVIKSGGEWISSVDLENTLMGHPAVFEAAVVAVPDDRWDERPLACVVLRAGSDVNADELAQYLADKVAKWWVPERWTFLESIPKTSVGKFDKKVLRSSYAQGDLNVVVRG